MLWLTIRQILRNPRRSFITLCSIVIGCASLIFVWGFIDGINSHMVDNSTGFVNGHVTIHRAGYHEIKELNFALTDQPSLLQVVKEAPEVAGLSARIEGYALVSAEHNSAMMKLLAVDPAQETQVTRTARSIVAGRYLMTGEANEIVLGDDAVQSLQLEIGDEIALIVQAADGSIGADRFTLVGSFNTGIEMMDKNIAYISLPSAQELYSLWGRFTTLTLRLHDRTQAEPVAEILQSRLGPDYEVLSWQKTLPSLLQMLRFHEAVAWVVLFVVFTVVAAGITNTVLMSVMERRREFGVMMAVGTQSPQITQLVLMESAIIGLSGTLIGTLLGTGINLTLGKQGLDFSAFTEAMETMPGLSGIVYPYTDLTHTLIVNIVVLLVTVIPALLPAWRASKLDPVVAIRGKQTDSSLIPFSFKRLSQSRAVFWLIALRSLFRSPKRGLLTAGATAFGLAAYLFLYAFTDGFFEQMIENSVGLISGHIQLSDNRFRQELSPKYPIDHTNERLSQLTPIPEIASASPRVVTKAMVASSVKSWPVELYGIQPDQERRVTSLFEKITQGTYLSETSENGAVVGQKTAEQLKLRVGDKLIATLQNTAGELTSAALEVHGIFDTGSEVFDGGYVFVPINTLRALLGYHTNQSSMIAIRLHQRTFTTPVTAQLNQQSQEPNVIFEPWERIMPVVVQMVAMTKIDFYVILVVVFIVVAMGVMNTMVMSVMERTREFGVMMALGTQPAHLIRLILYEALALGVFGMLAGTAMGTAIVTYYGHTGIDLSSLSRSMETIPGMTSIIFPVLILDHVWLPSLLLFLCGVCVSIYPAVKASRMNPVEAIRHG